MILVCFLNVSRNLSSRMVCVALDIVYPHEGDRVGGFTSRVCFLWSFLVVVPCSGSLWLVLVVGHGGCVFVPCF